MTVPCAAKLNMAKNSGLSAGSANSTYHAVQAAPKQIEIPTPASVAPPKRSAAAAIRDSSMIRPAENSSSSAGASVSEPATITVRWPKRLTMPGDNNWTGMLATIPSAITLTKLGLKPSVSTT